MNLLKASAHGTAHEIYKHEAHECMNLLPSLAISAGDCQSTMVTKGAEGEEAAEGNETGEATRERREGTGGHADEDGGY